MRIEPSSLTALPQRFLMALVRGYRLLLSPWLGSACRFEPTCSAYSLQALKEHGAAAGTYLTLRRLARCHPLCAGGHDPVPARAKGVFRHFTGGDSLPTAAPFRSPTDKTAP
jgi:uncharacterized protein